LQTGGEPVRALIRGVQFHPVTDNPITSISSADRGERVKVQVPVHFENDGISPGLKRGGVLNVVRHAVEVYCEPDHIPISSPPTWQRSISTTTCVGTICEAPKIPSP